MKLLHGFVREYRKRHMEIWPEITSLLKEAGVSDYSIFFDEESNCLLAVLSAENPDLLNDLAANPMMQRWWLFMSDIMETHPDNSPVSVPLKEVFYLA